MHSNFNKFDLSGKYALVTGAAGMLGKQHTLALIEAGANIIFTDINMELINKTISEIENEVNTRKIDLIKLVMNVSNNQEIIKVSNELKTKNINLDILINNAAIDPKFDSVISNKEESRLENYSIENWNKEISVGLTGAFLCSKIFGSQMAVNNRGVIINIASDLSVISPDQRLYKRKDTPSYLQPVKPVTYSVIKSGLVGLTKYIATYWSDKGIRCNALSPGGVFNNHDKSFVKNLSHLIPLNRMAEISEYKSAIQFLCSDASSYMNGQNLIIDGGRSCW